MPNIFRHLQPRILDSLGVSPVVFVNGPRQAGKSTLVQALSAKQYPATYVTFDNITQMSAAATAPLEYLRGHGDRLIIDEVQLVPEVFRALKIVVDELRQHAGQKSNGRYLLTGSANILALPKLSDALVGRVSVLTLHPFSTAEVLGHKGTFIERLFAGELETPRNPIPLLEAIQIATFPEISGKPDAQRSIWFEGYLSTILQRDVRMLAELEKIAVLPKLLRILAHRAGQLINDAEISRDVELNRVTGRTYRMVLQMMFLTFEVMPWFRNIGKRLIKSPKGYLIDTLLLCHLMDWKIEHLARRRPDLFGHVAENYVASELLKLLSVSTIHAQLLHYRTAEQREVDFIIENRKGQIAGIEVKSAENVESKDFKALREIQQTVGKDFAAGIVLHQGKDIVPFGKNLWAVPFSVLWM